MSAEVKRLETGEVVEVSTERLEPSRFQRTMFRSSAAKMPESSMQRAVAAAVMGSGESHWREFRSKRSMRKGSAKAKQ
jgi:hypothetical protein